MEVFKVDKKGFSIIRCSVQGLTQDLTNTHLNFEDQFLRMILPVKCLVVICMHLKIRTAKHSLKYFKEQEKVYSLIERGYLHFADTYFRCFFTKY